MKASTVGALFLGALISTLDALPTNATSLENPSRHPFEFSRTFGLVEYFYSGSCDATTQYESGGKNSINMDVLILDLWSEPRSRPIIINASYIRLIFDAELSIQFPMRGGFPIKCNTGADILDKLRDYFIDNPDMDQRPCRGSISVRGNVKIAFSFEKVPVMRVSLQPVASVRAEGNTWPSRQLSASIMDRLIQEADQYMSQQNPGAMVPENLKQRWGPLEEYFMSWEWSENRRAVFTRLTWFDSRLLLAAIGQYFHSHVTAKTVFNVAVQGPTGWGECAWVTFGQLPDPGPGAEDPLSLNLTQIASSSPLNNTILSLGNSSASGDSSVGSGSSVSTT